MAENASSIICLPSIPPKPTSNIYFHRTRNGPQLRQMANGSSDQFSEESRGKVQKFMFVIFISDILTYKTQKQMTEIFEFGLIHILENLQLQTFLLKIPCPIQNEKLP